MSSLSLLHLAALSVLTAGHGVLSSMLIIHNEYRCRGLSKNLSRGLSAAFCVAVLAQICINFSHVWQVENKRLELESKRIQIEEEHLYVDRPSLFFCLHILMASQYRHRIHVHGS